MQPGRATPALRAPAAPRAAPRADPRQQQSQLTMEHQAEINRLAIFLFCLLVPLGSSAPTNTSKESKIPTGQRQKHFSTDTKPLLSVIEKRATDLFERYNSCISQTLQGKTWLLDKSKAKDMVKKIPECPASYANCCALHHIYSTLQGLRGDVEILCNSSSLDAVDANIIQLNTTLSERAAFYTCRSQDLPQGYPSQVQAMSSADRMSYILWFLEKYVQIIQNTRKITYDEEAIQ